MESLITISAGAVAGIVADVVTHPLSTVKTRLQVEGAQSAAAAQAKRPNPVALLFRVGSQEGAAALFRGVGVVVAAAAPGQALYFSGYEAVRAAVPRDSGLSGFASGVAAQLCGALAWVPMDVVKERLQIEGQLKTVENYGSSWNAVRGIVKMEGVVGMYRAFWIHQMTWAPFNGLYFASYDFCKQSIKPHQGSVPDIAVNLTSSLLAASLASVLTSPLDLVKTRLQVQGSNPEIFDYKGPVDAFQKIVKREGVRALFDGVAARVLWLTPRLSIAVPTYEYLKKHFEEMTHK